MGLLIMCCIKSECCMVMKMKTNDSLIHWIHWNVAIMEVRSGLGVKLPALPGRHPLRMESLFCKDCCHQFQQPLCNLGPLLGLSLHQDLSKQHRLEGSEGVAIPKSEIFTSLIWWDGNLLAHDCEKRCVWEHFHAPNGSLFPLTAYLLCSCT